MAAVAALACLPALADQTWLGTTDNQWTTQANWSGNALPGVGDWVIFNNLSTTNLSTELGQDFTVGTVMVSNPPGPVIIDSPANTLTLAAGTGIGINMTNATQPLTISAAVNVGAGQSWVVASNQTLTVSGTLGGTGGIYKDGFGALVLSGFNSFTGPFTNNGGPVYINNSYALGSGTKTIYIANNNVGAGLHLDGSQGSVFLPNTFTFIVSDDKGTIINDAGDNTILGPLYEYSGGGQAYLVVSNGTLTVDGNIGLNTSARPFEFGGPANGTLSGTINAAGIAVRKVDSGTWMFNSTSAYTYTNYTTVEGGTLALGSGVTIPKTVSIDVFSNATLDVSQDSPFTLSPGTVNQMLLGAGSVNGSITAANGSVIFAGSNNAPGTLTFSNNLTMNSGAAAAFSLGTATTAGGGVNSLLNVQGTFDPQGASVQIYPYAALTSPGTYLLVNYGSEASQFNSTVAATGTRYIFTVNDTGSGKVYLNVSGGPASLEWYGGNNGGLWDVTTTVNWNNNTQKFYNGDNVTFDDTGLAGAVVLNTTVQPGSVTFSNNTVNYVLSGSGKITGTTGLTKTGTANLGVSSAGHTYTGPVVINGGTLAINSVALNGNASTLGAGTNITLNGGTLQFGGARPAASSFNRLFTLGPNGGTVLSTNGTFFIPGVISGPGSFTKTGSVQVILGDIVASVLTNANNTYTGNTLINQGELQIRNANALGRGKAIVSSGADLAVGGGANYGTVTNEIDLNGDGSSSAGALQANDAGTVVTFGGTIDLVTSSTVGVFANASGFTISGPIVGPGALKKGSHATCTVTLTCPTNSYTGGTLVTGGTLQLGNGGTAGSLGTGLVTNNGTMAYDHSDTTTVAAAISGSGNLTHTGSGTLILGGGNSYAGSTAVNGGTVLVNGSLGSGSVTVAANATLGGYGTIAGPVTIQGGGTLALGSSIGTLTINNTLALNGINVMKLSRTGAPTNDLIQGVTTLTFGGTLTVTSTGTLQAGDSFRLFNAGTYTGTFAATNLPALSAGLSWNTSNLYTTGTLTVNGSGTQPPPPQFVGIPFKLSNGTYQLKFSNSIGNYRLWATTNVGLRPITNTWMLLSSGTFTGGTVTFTDTQATNYPDRYYLITIP